VPLGSRFGRFLGERGEVASRRRGTEDERRSSPDRADEFGRYLREELERLA
jgi:hypothetical protein